MITKIISGGQSGADRAALDVAINMNIPHGGWLPKGRLTEEGPLPDRYQLQEMPTDSYPKRTEQNVIDSNGTLILTHGKLTGGSKLTQEYAHKHHKPCLHVDLNKHQGEDALYAVINWVKENEIEVLNVAGSRASKDPLIYDEVFELLNHALLVLQVRSSKDRPPAPKTVYEAVEFLLTYLTLKDQTKIGNMSEDDLNNLHFSLGTYIRNNFGLWGGDGRLMDDCRRLTGNLFLHEDDASSIIIKELWKRLRE
jgi:hypothetical protein